MNTFYIYDQKTGEYIGKRQTSQSMPIWQPGVEAVKEAMVPSSIKAVIKATPQNFRRIKGNFVELSRKDKDKKKKKFRSNHAVDVH